MSWTLALSAHSPPERQKKSVGKFVGVGGREAVRVKMASGSKGLGLCAPEAVGCGACGSTLDNIKCHMNNKPSN